MGNLDLVLALDLFGILLASEVELHRTHNDTTVTKSSKDANKIPKRTKARTKSRLEELDEFSVIDTADGINQNASTSKKRKSMSKDPYQSDAGIIKKARSSIESSKSKSKPNQNFSVSDKPNQNLNKNVSGSSKPKQNFSVSDLFGESATGNKNKTGG